MSTKSHEKWPYGRLTLTQLTGECQFDHKTDSLRAFVSFTNGNCTFSNILHCLSALWPVYMDGIV
eukprot:10556187-Karenia_brevis.AAC.1